MEKLIEKPNSIMNVSAVIPLYNREAHIQRALHSILNQTYPISEIIVVDDGSTDNSCELVRGIKDSRIKIIHQDNSGQHAARNTGWIAASNPFVAFLDADDEWKPNFLLRIIELVNLFPEAGLFATSTEIIKPNGAFAYPKLDLLQPEPWIGIIPNFFELFQDGFVFNSSSVVIPKKVLIEVAGFPADATYLGDVTCWVNISLRYNIAFDSDRLAVYHQEAENRLGPKYKFFITEAPFIKNIDKALQNGTIPKNLQKEALNFKAQKQIMVAAENVMAGNPAYARGLLATCRGNQKYWRDWLKWRFWAAWPPGWPAKLLALKTLLRRKLSRIYL